MAVKSYLAFTEPTQSMIFEGEISKIRGCELIASKEKHIYILITESEDEANEKKLMADIESITSIKCLSLVGVWDTSQ